VGLNFTVACLAISVIRKEIQEEATNSAAHKLLWMKPNLVAHFLDNWNVSYPQYTKDQRCGIKKNKGSSAMKDCQMQSEICGSQLIETARGQYY